MASVVSSAAELATAIQDASVTIIQVNGTITLGGDAWRPGLITLGKDRHVLLTSVGADVAAIDCAGAYDALCVEGELTLRNLLLRGIAPRSAARINTRAQFQLEHCNLWPSFVVMPGAQMHYADVIVYGTSELSWRQCAVFQDAMTNDLRKDNKAASVVRIGTTGLSINTSSPDVDHITDLATGLPVGEASRSMANYTFYCMPSADGTATASAPASGASAQPQAQLSRGLELWQAVAVALGVMLAALAALAVLATAVHMRRRRRPRVSDSKDPEAAILTAPDASQHSSFSYGRAEEDALGDPSRPGPPAARSSSARLSLSAYPGLGPGSGLALEQQAAALAAAEGGAQLTSMMSLPDILRARSASQVGSLVLGACLGRGSYGKVYKGKWNGVTVAVKVVEHAALPGGTMELRESVMGQSIVHPNISATYKIRTMCLATNEGATLTPPTLAPPPGASGEEPCCGGGNPKACADGEFPADKADPCDGVPDCRMETWMLLEYCDRGNLDRAISSGLFRRRNGWPDLDGMLRCLIDIAAGMDYLHSLGVIHGDLKGANCLLKSTACDPRGFTVKLCDLGLSHLLTNSTHVVTQTYGTIAFQPVELLRDGKLSKAVDVYSFAMVTWELYTGERLYAGSIPSQIFFKALMGFRPSVPPDMHVGLRTLMEECWHANPERRPPFKTILTQLRALLEIASDKLDRRRSLDEACEEARQQRR
ncbi:hypothetical protein WJX81_005126 [Elliptochloris bilobata]|uniref:Protein kinase domain-containing protein n=1 Tax=Elliptochloris bilobata TaxID=381761 RepID=A0AAW1RWY1_9CHLO